MVKGLLSVIIPDRQEQFLQKTVDDLLAKAEESVEIICVMDGAWNENFNWNKENIVVIHHGVAQNSLGMRASINAGIAVAKGEYIMVLDGHCMMEQSYDKVLKGDCEDNWLVIPRRGRLDPEKWEAISDGRPDIDYMFIDFPLRKESGRGLGLHGIEDRQRGLDRKDILIDDIMTGQGSCYFLKRKFWDIIGPLDDENYGHFAQEAQEITFRAWLSGGQVKVNKKTKYCHLHKGSKYGKNYGFSNAQYKEHGESVQKGRAFCNDFWLNDKWDKRIHDFEWLIEKFWPLPGWPDDWAIQLKKVDLIK
jgi:glycosyltransferase involved in cell wall biosynthesis